MTSEQPPAEPVAPRERNWPRWQDHIGLILAGATGAVIALRLSAITAFDPTTTFAILRELGIANVLLGTLLTLEGNLLLILMAALLVWGVRTRRHRAAIVAAGLTVGVVAAWVAPAAFVVGYSAFPIAECVRQQRATRQPRRSHQRNKMLERAIGLMGISCAASAVVLTLILNGPWLPLEVVITSDGTPRVGYVLNGESGRVVLLTRTSRTVVYIDDVSSREICQSRSSNLRQFGLSGDSTLLPRPRPEYRECPSGTDSDGNWQWLGR